MFLDSLCTAEATIVGLVCACEATTLSKTNVVGKATCIVHRKLKKNKMFLLSIIRNNIEMSDRIFIFFLMEHRFDSEKCQFFGAVLNME